MTYGDYGNRAMFLNKLEVLVSRDHENTPQLAEAEGVVASRCVVGQEAC